MDLASAFSILKELAEETGFHCEDSRHYVETYSMIQRFEADFHPADHCDRPVTLSLSLEVDPRTMLVFDDIAADYEDSEEPDFEDPGMVFPLTLEWTLPPLRHAPDQLNLALDLSATGGADLPLRITSIEAQDLFPGENERYLRVHSQIEVSLLNLYWGGELMSDELMERCLAVTAELAEKATAWLAN